MSTVRSVWRLAWTWHMAAASTLVSAKVENLPALPPQTRVLANGLADPLAHTVKFPFPAAALRSRMLIATPVASAGTPLLAFLRSIGRAVLAGSGVLDPPDGDVPG